MAGKQCVSIPMYLRLRLESKKKMEDVSVFEPFKIVRGKKDGWIDV